MFENSYEDGSPKLSLYKYNKEEDRWDREELKNIRTGDVILRIYADHPDYTITLAVSDPEKCENGKYKIYGYNYKQTNAFKNIIYLKCPTCLQFYLTERMEELNHIKCPHCKSEYEIKDNIVSEEEFRLTMKLREDAQVLRGIDQYIQILQEEEK